ncbi:chorismate mutase [Planomicrobium sp. YIM 101495]|uniref:chorismate mutase n=1 Tax=Planomicrobium sp. YIM 101495 TaxID=2665160 RepID=UPI0012B91944|nr:chorismate mutase [Planomicrobium sp. YIM 101495]MTD30059.1 chorismate mutase [Planomicrobium sp. YIM 101495]
MIRGVRGATTVTEDHADEIFEATRQLALQMVAENSISPDEVASVIISTTTDLSSAFPAKAIRTIEGWTYVPVMCTHEMSVPNSLPRCIRLMMHVNTKIAQQEIRHIYLNDATKLRPDLVQKQVKSV